jgi:hypothetical protein
MRDRLWVCLLVAGIGWAVAPNSVEAQYRVLRGGTDFGENSSHIEIPTLPGDPNAADKARKFMERLFQARARQLARDILANPKKYPLSEQQQQLVEQLRNNPALRKQLPNIDLNDPNIQQLMRGFLQQQQGGSSFLKPDQLEEIKKWLDEQPRPEGAPTSPSESGPSRPGSPGQRPDRGERPPRVGPGRAPEQPAPPPSAPIERPASPQQETPLASAAVTRSTAIDPAEQERRAHWARQFRQWSERMQEMAPFLRNSQTVRDLAREFARFNRGVDGGGFKMPEMPEMPEGLRSRLSRLPDLSGLQRFAPKGGWKLPENLPSLPRIDWSPGGSNWGGGASLPRVPLPRGDVPRGESWLIVLWLVGLGVVALLLWKSRLLTRDTAGARAAGWRLGPWPVQPAAVRTREELVRAYEHLALLTLGPAARHWHHREIECRLGKDAKADNAARHQAAAELTDAYEQARYAPTAEPLPDAVLTAARRDLCLLAGVPAA